MHCTAHSATALRCTPAFTRRAQSSSPRPAGPVEHTAAPRCAVLHRPCLPAVSAHVPSSASLRRLPKGTATGTAGRARWRAARRRSAAVCAVCADLAGLVAVGDDGRRHSVLGPHRADLRRRAGLVWFGLVGCSVASIRTMPRCTQHATYSMPHATYSRQHTKYSIQRARPHAGMLGHTVLSV